MYSNRPSGRPQISFGGGHSGPPPRDLLILLGVLFFTFSLQFFAATAILPTLLRLSAAAWQRGFVWQLASYPVIGYGPPSLWFLLELLILFWFGRDVYRYLGRRHFWQLLAWACIGAAVAALAVDGLARLGGASAGTFQLMQGQRMLLTVTIAAFATLYGHATIYLFFVLPIQARWFIALEILFAFMAFLATKDLAGFVGICVGVGLTYGMLAKGGLGRLLHNARLRLRHLWYRARLAYERRRRGLRAVPGRKGDRDRRSGDGGDGGDGGDVRRGPWVN